MATLSTDTLDVIYRGESVAWVVNLTSAIYSSTIALDIISRGGPAAGIFGVSAGAPAVAAPRSTITRQAVNRASTY